MQSQQEHYGDLSLRRYFIGELQRTGEDASLVAHLEDCELCRARIEALVAEERDFQGKVDFESFAEGVEARLETPAAQTVTRKWIAPLSAVAAAAAVIGVVSLPATGPGTTTAGGYTGLKGTPAQIDVYVGGAGGQRTALTREPLAAGERIRIAYRPGEWRYLAVVSVDEAGEVSALYPEAGESLRAQGGPRQTRMLPDSVAFSGPGLERIIVVFSNAPLGLETLSSAVSESLAAAEGDVDRMGDLVLAEESEQFHRLVIKP